jgi:hypothetical protein
LGCAIFGDGQIILILLTELVGEQTAGYYVNNGQTTLAPRALCHTRHLWLRSVDLPRAFFCSRDQKFAFTNSRWRTHERKIHTLVAHTLLLQSISPGKNLHAKASFVSSVKNNNVHYGL